MSEQVKKEQTKGAKQEKITELSDATLDEVRGGVAKRTETVILKRADSSDGIEPDETFFVDLTDPTS